ncbi:hypothetical protein IFM53868_07467 [Aspergillus udagawae]|uniref:C2H2-type domain-containing protein n=1 Tax=Aspergillus udagawae TaxID=91492 RepID=A0ABQ1B5N3_9EURO|nr:hypothetical protein IFM53868_07467 [Aspergillus udagawae]
MPPPPRDFGPPAPIFRDHVISSHRRSGELSTLPYHLINTSHSTTTSAMARVRAHEAYQRYLQIPKPDLKLPDAVIEDSGHVDLYVSEVYCRYSSCEVDTKYMNLNNLKKHFVAKYSAEFKENSGGRLKKVNKDAAIAWYTELVAAYDACKAAKPKVRLVIPLKHDGTVNMTAMRTLVKDHDIQVPCDCCKADKKLKNK